MSYSPAILNSLDSIFGDGSSGSATCNSSYVFQDSAYDNLTITNNSASIYAVGIRIFVKDTLTINTQNVTLNCDGSAGGGGTAGYLGGAGGSAGSSFSKYTACVGSTGEYGTLLNGAICDSADTAGCSTPYCFGGRGGKGGSGGTGIWGDPANYEYAGAVANNATISRPIVPLHPNVVFNRIASSSSWYAGQGGGGGSAGGGCAYCEPGSPNGGGGGAGGNGGNMLLLFIKKLVLTSNLTINARGGIGGSGGIGTIYPANGNAAGGSGGGGGGGCVILVVGERSGSGTLKVDVSGGNGQYGYASGGIGSNGSPGYGGSKGALFYVNLASGTSVYYPASDAIQPSITGEAAVYTL